MMVSLTLPVVATWKWLPPCWGLATLVNSFFSTATIVDCDRSFHYIKGRVLNQMLLEVLHDTFSHAMWASMMSATMHDKECAQNPQNFDRRVTLTTKLQKYLICNICKIYIPQKFVCIRGEPLWYFEAIMILEHHISWLWEQSQLLILTIFDEKLMQKVMFDKVLCVLWIFGIRIAITIMRGQHQHHGCEEDIAKFNIIKIIAQL